MPKNTEDNQYIAQCSETRDEGDSLSCGNEDTRPHPTLEPNEQMADIVVAGSEEDPGATIPVETELNSNTVYELENITHKFDGETLKTRKFIVQSQGNPPL